MAEDAPQTFFGTDAIARAIATLSGVPTRPLVLCGPSRRHVESVLAALGDVDVRVFDEARVHVPRATVDAAMEVVGAHAPDVLVSVGGGSATGLAKALRLTLDVPFIAVPTTYSGSEMTRIYGITEAANKTTGRELRVRPDAVAYDPRLTSSMPRGLTVQSLLNALAHPMSALSTGALSPDDRDHALRTFGALAGVVCRLAERPTSVAAREDAARWASAAAAILDRCPLGVHHSVAHRLGGRFDLPHAALHAILLPHSLATLRDTDGPLFDALMQACTEADPPAALMDALRLVGAPTSLSALEVDGDAIADALGDDLASTRTWVDAAFDGRRPSRHVARVRWDHGAPLSVFGDPGSATDVVLAIHGRGATADAIVQRARETIGDVPHVAIVAPHAPGNAWYRASYRVARTEDAAALDAAVQTVAHARAWVDAHAPAGARVHVFGFSQGACVALEYAAQARGLASVIAWAGARPRPLPRAPLGDALAGVPVCLGAAVDDRWLDAPDLDADAQALTDAGADVSRLMTPGDVHQIAALHRLHGHAVITGRDPRAGSAGFGNAHAGQALPGSLPIAQNSPRRPPYGLYAEQINGTGFVAARGENRRTWMYRLRPSASHPPFSPLPHPTFTDDYHTQRPAIDLVGHAPLPLPRTGTDFVDGLHTYGGQGSPSLRRGFAIHLYVANRSMDDRAFYDADGDLLIVPQHGRLTLQTELGPLDVAPGRIAIVPRGIRFSVLLQDESARGWVGEVFGRHFELPDRGAIGANGLADERHFVAPTPFFEDRLSPGYRLCAKSGGRLYETLQSRSPYDVVAWHGNYTPYAYDLSRFAPVSYVAFDHVDPSAYLVVTSPLDERGADSLDFVVFPARWDPTAHTFRPPYFHRNAVTEFNGVIRQPARAAGPFVPGTSFLTPIMTAHGVRARAAERAWSLDDATADRPERVSANALWFQFESALPLSLSSWAQTAHTRISDWSDVWGRYPSHYDPEGAD